MFLICLWIGVGGWLFLVDENVLKLLLCLFFDDVLCAYRKDAKFTVMARCLKCRHYMRFEREMDEADQKFMDEVDEMRRTGVWK